MDCLVGMGSNLLGGLLKHVPCQTPSPMDRVLLLHNTFARGRASSGGARAQLFSLEGKHKHIPEEREGLSPFSCSGAVQPEPV